MKGRYYSKCHMLEGLSGKLKTWPHILSIPMDTSLCNVVFHFLSSNLVVNFFLHALNLCLATGISFLGPP